MSVQYDELGLKRLKVLKWKYFFQNLMPIGKA